MHSKFSNRSTEDLQKEFIYKVRKFIFGLNIDLPAEQLQVLRDEIKELMEALYGKNYRPLEEPLKENE